MSFSLLLPLRDIPMAFLDVETTGASLEFGHRVIEIGVARVENGQIVAQYEQLIDPRRPISPGVTVLTGISQPMVAGQPTFAEQLPRLMQILSGAIVLGHNVRFDLSFIEGEFRRAGRDIVAELCNCQVMDTVRIARKRFGRGGNGLQSLAPRLGYVPPVAHRALPDAITTYHVFKALLEPVGGWNLSLCDAIIHQGGPMGLISANPKKNPLPLELEEALEQRCSVMMEYVDASDNRTERVVQPMEIRRLKGELVLIAHCRLRNERRHFKIERIASLKRMAEVETSQPVASLFTPQA
ncbi:MAG TPA: exonuclease domain-containing protein [Tepidisphaeraceae bacterium]|nr:exonuclease domain-containing protein [Tepidisphaeraceae bacterium]